MITQFPIKLILILAVLLFLFSLPGIADARGFSRGGGGFSRSAASSGSVQKQAQFSGQQGSMQRSTQPATEQRGAADRQSQRQEAAGGMQQDRQDYHTENREDWQDYGEDAHWDNHWHGDVNQGQAFVAGAMVGATAVAATRPVTTTYVTTLPCSYTTAFVNGVTYYQCGTTWYSRGYVNGTVNYVVVQKPF